jgi:hypothetical protein
MWLDTVHIRRNAIFGNISTHTSLKQAIFWLPERQILTQISHLKETRTDRIVLLKELSQIQIVSTDIDYSIIFMLYNILINH